MSEAMLHSDFLYLHGTAAEALPCYHLAQPLSLKQRSETDAGQEGFLLGWESEADYQAKMSKGMLRLLKSRESVDDNNTLAAFLLAFELDRVSRDDHFEHAFDEATRHWMLKTFSSTEKVYHIDKIAVSQTGHPVKGLGTYLYQQFLAEMGQAHFLAWIVTNPVENKPSIGLHQKLGFLPVLTAEIICHGQRFEKTLYHLNRTL